jgi:hypothetical protein
MSGGLVIVGAMQIIVPLIVVLMHDSIPVLDVVLDPNTCILGMKDVSKVPFASTLVMLQPKGGHAFGQVPTWALAMVRVFNSSPDSWV